VEFSGDLFDQRILLQHFRLRLHISPVGIGAGGCSGIDVMEIEEILVNFLDFKRSLGLVQAGLGDGNKGGSKDGDARDPSQGGLAPIQGPRALGAAPLPKAREVDAVGVPTRAWQRG
jgi:hypothetical protein